MNQAKPTQRCPICGAVQPLSSRLCAICGARLPGQPTPANPTTPVKGKKAEPRPRYDPVEGDDDLYAGDLLGRMGRLLLVTGIGIALVLGIGIGLAISQMRGDDDPRDEPEVYAETIATERATVYPTATQRDLFSTPTAAQTRPSIALPTVTPMPPTATITPTPTPCMQTAQEGDTVYGMAIRCGHVDMAVVDLILELNDMKSATELQLGQTLEIPWPTPTPGGEPTLPAATEEGSDSGGVETVSLSTTVNEFGTPDALATYQNSEPTLRPGMAWHTVTQGQTLYEIVLIYDTSAEVLSQINPEIPFLQCDFGIQTGGPNCSVSLSIGQRLRVPVPLPTQTMTPTPVGTLTPTPTATATFNAPFLSSPDDKTHFHADELVTLRWLGTGTLAANERYLVRVTDTTIGQDYEALVFDLLYKLPGGWQPMDGKSHDFEWTISIVTVDAQNNVVNEDHITEARHFTWDSY
jgi:LysM repeat protein